MKLYNVSDKAVRNWIVSAHKNNTPLKLCVDNTKTFIADTSHNRQVIESLVVKGRKYRNRRSYRSLKPTSEFYRLYDSIHILDIVNRLDTNHELPWEYLCFGEGGEYWNEYLNKLQAAGKGNILTNTTETLELAYPYIDALLSSYENINIINICVGNYLNARHYAEHLHRKGKLRRLVAVDISQMMLDIAGHNVDAWFEGEVVLEKHRKNIENQRLDEIIAHDSFGFDASQTANVVLFLGGPIMNFRDTEQVFRNIRNSMGRNDLLITSIKRDTEQSREFFDFNIDSDEKVLNNRHKLLLKLLNIDDSFYDVEQVFDSVEKQRRVQIRLKLDISIDFEVGSFYKTIHLNKGDVILLLRVWHFSDEDITRHLSHTDFRLQHVSKSIDDQILLLMTSVQPRLTL